MAAGRWRHALGQGAISLTGAAFLVITCPPTLGVTGAVAAAPTSGTSTTGTTAATTTTATTVPPGNATHSAPPALAAPQAPPAPNLPAIRSAQAAIVSQRFQLPTVYAELAVSGSELSLTTDQQTLAGDQAQAEAAQAIEQTATVRLATDQTALRLAASRDRQARARLAGDRARLRGLALGMYTGALTGPQPAALKSLATAQQAAFDGSEVNVVAQVVVADLGIDTRAAAVADRRLGQLTASVAADIRQLATDRGRAVADLDLIPPAAAVVAVAQRQLTASLAHLASVGTALKSALAAVAGPRLPAGSGVSILGSAALDASDLTVWFSAQGYSDLTSTTVTQLADWYLKEGAAEGVRGDVAFAQAVLETGGFASSDAVALNNYAGIGHCDTCAQGWAFPSPEGGVVGQLQLLRIFAGAGGAPKPAPPPVLPALTAAHQPRQGCCATWESLTGVWATDRFYGTRILLMYEQMLALAESGTAGGSGQPSAPGA